MLKLQLLGFLASMFRGLSWRYGRLKLYKDVNLKQDGDTWDLSTNEWSINFKDAPLV